MESIAIIIVAVLSFLQSVWMTKHVQEIKLQLNGRLDELLEHEKHFAYQRGFEYGKNLAQQHGKETMEETKSQDGQGSP